MRKFLITSAALALTFSAAGAKSTGFDGVNLRAEQPVKITVSLSEDLLHRADNLPKNFHDRGQARGRNNGWSGNGHYGLRDLNELKDKVTKQLTRDFNKVDIPVSDTAGYELRVTLVDAKPTRPTFRQMSKQPGLSFRSLGNGGATFSASVIDPSGNVVSTSEYDWYETYLQDNFGSSTWADARRAISRFSRNTVKTLSAD